MTALDPSRSWSRSSLALAGALVGCTVDRDPVADGGNGLASAGEATTRDTGEGSDGGDAPADADTTSEGSTAPAPTDDGSSGSETTGNAPGDGERLRYGLAIDPDSTPAELDAAFAHYADIGVDHIWVSAAMEWLCEQPASCDFTPLDAVVDRAEAAGWTVALQVHGSPQWLDPRGIWFGPDTDALRAGWIDLFAQLVDHFGTRVGWYEVWNEPNIVEFWSQGPDPAAYGRLLHDAHVTAHGIEPAVAIVGGNLSQCDLGFLAAMYDALDEAYGAADAAANRYWFDVLGVHPYAGDEAGGWAPSDDTHPDVDTPFGAKDPDYLGYRRLYELVAAREGAAKDLVFGELGYDTTGGWFTVTEDERATYLAEALQLARDDGFVRYATWFTHDGTWFGIHGTPTEAAFTAAATAP